MTSSPYVTYRTYKTFKTYKTYRTDTAHRPQPTANSPQPTETGVRYRNRLSLTP